MWGAGDRGWTGATVVIPDIEVDVPHVDEATVDELDDGVDSVGGVWCSRLCGPVKS